MCHLLFLNKSNARTHTEISPRLLATMFPIYATVWLFSNDTWRVIDDEFMNLYDIVLSNNGELFPTKFSNRGKRVG